MTAPPSPEPGHIPNRADDAWARLLQLRADAQALGIAVDERWPIDRLEEEIARAS